MSDEFEVSQGFEQGGTLSPTLFTVFVDGLLEDIWAHCPGVSFELANGQPGKMPALLFADDFAGVADNEADMQVLVDRVRAYFLTWRMKVNVKKSAVLVFNGKGRGAGQAGKPQIMWGDELIPVRDRYTYMGVVLHDSGGWGPHLAAAADKVIEKANKLTPLLKGRGASGEIKRMVIHTLLRPTFEWGGGVWHPHRKADMSAIDSVQMQLIKSAFHCPAYTCHTTLLQEVGMRPMSMWLDKRLLEMWHRVCNMDEDRVVKQVLFGSFGQPTRRCGRRPSTWLDLVDKTLSSWDIDKQGVLGLNRHQFKQLLNKQVYKVLEKRQDSEEAESAAVAAYNTWNGPWTLKKPKAYLCGGPCDKGKELILQLRTQSLPLASLTGKFGRRRRDNPDDPSHFICPVCTAAHESQGHFLLECQAYQEFREDMFEKLESLVPAELVSFRASNRSLDAKACMLLDDSFWGVDSQAVANVVSPFVYNCWMTRIDVVYGDSAARRVADGSNAGIV